MVVTYTLAIWARGVALLPRLNRQVGCHKMATSDLTYGHVRPDIGKTRTKKNGVSNYGMAYQITEAYV